MTGWCQQDDRSRTADAGFNEHLAKPVDPLHLINRLDALLATHAIQGTKH
jgi:DNA-binding response OmpR family regulator